MKLYELTYLISPGASLAEAKTLAENTADLIRKEGGIATEMRNPFRRKLAFAIKKEGEAFLASIDFYFDPEKIRELSEKIKSEGKVFRALLFKKKEFKKIELPKILEIKKEEKVDLEEIEKKLEEILGNNL